jgi:hypothetical protein
MTFDPDHADHIVGQLVGGDPGADEAVVALARAGCDDVRLLVAAAVLTRDAGLLVTASAGATEPRDRQLAAVAAAWLRGDRDLFDALVRDHLVTYPDQLLAAWLAGHPR